MPPDSSALTLAIPTARVNGRPTKKTPENRLLILAEIAQGTPKTCAAVYCGVSRSTFAEWEKEDPTWADDIDHATAYFRQRLQSAANRLALEDANLMKFLLANRMPDTYGFTNKKDTAVSVNVSVSVGEAKRTEYQQREKAALEGLGCGRN